jgi:CheY-like chemotaxis protein
MALLSRQSVASGRILVVEDDQRARDLIVRSLRADGHDVDASGDGTEALRMMGRHWYDLIVSDIKMPELDGPNLYSEAARRWPTGPPPFLFVSRLGPTSEYDGFLKVIGAPVLAQPLKAGQLRRAVRRIL